jgi:hypothetical protein
MILTSSLHIKTPFYNGSIVRDVKKKSHHIMPHNGTEITDRVIVSALYLSRHLESLLLY